MSTFEEIYDRMKQAYRKETGVLVQDASDVGLRFAVLAGEIYSLLCNCDWVKRQMFPDTAVGEALDLHAGQRGMSRKNAVRAVGSVTFGISQPAERRITIPANTAVSTSDASPISFITDADASIGAGQKSVTVSAVALVPGRSGNVPAGSIKNIVNVVPYVETVTNPRAFSGGTDDESDEELRDRIIDSFAHPSNGTNKAYYKAVCGEIDGVGSVGVIPRNRGVGTVDVFLAGQNTTASQQAVAEANRILSTAREVNVDAQAFAAKEKKVDLRIRVRTDGIYTQEDVSARCIEAVKELVSNSKVGEDILLSQIILMLMKLDGVTDVSFASIYGNVAISDDTKAVPGTFAVDFLDGGAA